LSAIFSKQLAYFLFVYLLKFTLPVCYRFLTSEKKSVLLPIEKINDI